jgi:hypothetical protein
MGQRLTQRQRDLRAAQERLKTARRQARAWVAEARNELDALSRCDWCRRVISMPSGAELQLCRECADIQIERSRQQAQADRVALLAAHGYDAKGRKIPATPSCASPTPR